jgi:hypothetical protein
LCEYNVSSVLIETLLKKKADVNVQNFEKLHPLDALCKVKNIETMNNNAIKLLLEYNSNPNSALFHCIKNEKCKIDTFDLFFQYGFYFLFSLEISSSQILFSFYFYRSRSKSFKFEFESHLSCIFEESRKC